MLPIYSGLSFTKIDPDIIITFNTINKKDGFQLRNDWENFNNFESHHIGICTENTAAFCVGKKPIHLTQFDIKNEEIMTVSACRIEFNPYMKKETNRYE